MIHSEDSKVHIEGYASTLLADLTGVIASLKSNIPEELIMFAVAMGLSHKEKSEDDKLAEEFMEELLKRVKEKRDAKCTD